MGWVAPLVPVTNGAVDYGSVGSSTTRWSHVASHGLYHGVSSLMTLLWQPSCHGEMGSLFGVGAASTELSSLFSELCFICAFDMYMCVFCAVCLCVFLVCTHAQGCLAMNE